MPIVYEPDSDDEAASRRPVQSKKKRKRTTSTQPASSSDDVLPASQVVSPTEHTGPSTAMGKKSTQPTGPANAIGKKAKRQRKDKAGAAESEERATAASMGGMHPSRLLALQPPEETLPKPKKKKLWDLDLSAMATPQLAQVLTRFCAMASLEFQLPPPPDGAVQWQTDMLLTAQELTQKLKTSTLQGRSRSSPVLLALSFSARRALLFSQHLKALQPKARVLKLFAKHIKVQEQIDSLKKSHVHVAMAVGTPARVVQLLQAGALSLDNTCWLMLDAGRDVKNFSLFRLPEVRAALCVLLRDFVPARVASSSSRQQTLPADSSSPTQQPLKICFSTAAEGLVRASTNKQHKGHKAKADFKRGRKGQAQNTQKGSHQGISKDKGQKTLKRGQVTCSDAVINQSLTQTHQSFDFQVTILC
eukprot:g26376.t1